MARGTDVQQRGLSSEEPSQVSRCQFLISRGQRFSNVDDYAGDNATIDQKSRHAKRAEIRRLTVQSTFCCRIGTESEGVHRWRQNVDDTAIVVAPERLKLGETAIDAGCAAGHRVHSATVVTAPTPADMNPTNSQRA